MDDLFGRIRADLARFRKACAALEGQLTGLRAEVSELEVAERVLRRYVTDAGTNPGRGDGSPSPEPRFAAQQYTAETADGPSDAPNDLFGKPIKEAARTVLAAIGRGEYGEIARMALARGYRSHKSGDDAEKITRSFYETMRRNPDEFVQSGMTFSLRRDGESSRAADPAEDDDAELAPDGPPPVAGPSDDPDAGRAITISTATIAGSVPGTATIDWGDGTTSAGTVVARARGVIEVGGSHTYARAGDYPLSVTLRTTDGP